jgi:hypothetical protein
MGYIDDNNKPVIRTLNDTTGKVDYLYCDPVTNAILVYAVAPDGNTPTAINRAFIDDSNKPTLLGYNETSGLIDALRCGVNGELLIKIVT